MTYPSSPKAALHVSDTAVCPECSGFGTVTIAHDTGVIGTGYLYEERCPECDGAGEIEAVCECCGGSLDPLGWCHSCEDFGITPDLDSAVIGDPFLRKDAA